MRKTFVISDTHFNHHNILNFLREDNTPLRVFDDSEHMDEYMIEQWNSVVQDGDRVYHLGDLTFSKTALREIMPRLNGDKVLVKGNHDMFKAKDYLKYFDDVRSYIIRPKVGLILSHYPIHPGSLKNEWLNVHGHLHYHRVLKGDDEDFRYVNVSVEQPWMMYTPIDMEALIAVRKLRLVEGLL